MWIGRWSEYKLWSTFHVEVSARSGEQKVMSGEVGWLSALNGSLVGESWSFSTVISSSWSVRWIPRLVVVWEESQAVEWALKSPSTKVLLDDSRLERSGM